MPLAAQGGSGNIDRKTWHLIIFAVCGVAGAVALIGATACYYNYSARQKSKEVCVFACVCACYYNMHSARQKSKEVNSISSFMTAGIFN